MKVTWPLSIFFISGAALALRVFRLGDFLGFWYDQGRDALVIWDLLYRGKFFLTGPTTGIEGIFLGPFYYYLIAPFYWIGRGNPLYPAVWLVILNIAALVTIYYLGRKFFSPITGLLAAFFMAFSYHLATSARWLSNPTPLPLFSALAVLALLQVTNGKSKWFWVLGMTLGLSLQLEAASAVFFLPAAVLILVANWRRVKTGWIPAFSAAGAFVLTLIPQLWFDFRHQHILLDAFRRFLVTENSFKPELVNILSQRLSQFYIFFSEKFFVSRELALIFTPVLIILAIIMRKKLFTSQFKTLIIWCLTPVLGLLFYHGNQGFVWGYYFTGVYPIFILVVAWIISQALSGSRSVRFAAGLFIAAFFLHNLSQLGLYLTRPAPGWVNFSSSLSAVDWVYRDSGGSDFNVDVYVPPVISYAYDYLFLWRGTTHYFKTPSASLVPRLYTLLEPDDQHPQLRDAWLARQAGYASIEKTVTFPPVTVQRRIRFSRP